MPKKVESFYLHEVQVNLVRKKVGELEVKHIHKKFHDSATAAKWAHSLLNGVADEHFLVVCLNIKNEVIGWRVVSIGSLNKAVVHPREVFKAALAANAYSIVLIHNHPSGEPYPSEEDKELTKRICECGKILGIAIVDSIIIAINNKDEREIYFSFYESEMLPK